jgi:hypothetical protein
MTLVSIKYTWRFRRLDALEVRVSADVGDRRQHLRQSALAGPRKRLGEDLPMLSLSASAVRTGTLFKRPDKHFIDTADEQVWHVSTSGQNDIIDIDARW